MIKINIISAVVLVWLNGTSFIPDPQNYSFNFTMLLIICYVNEIHKRYTIAPHKSLKKKCSKYKIKTKPWLLVRCGPAPHNVL